MCKEEKVEKEQTEEPKKEIQTRRPDPILANSNGLLVGKTIEEQYRLAKLYCQSGLMPPRFNRPETLMVAMQYCYELGLKPLTGLRQMAIIKGIPAIFGDLPLALAQQSGLVESFVEYLVNTKNEIITDQNLDTEVYAAICKVKRKGDQEFYISYFTIEDAKKSGLFESSDAWKKYPKDMLKYRARAKALKARFPDALNGIAIAEYDYNKAPQYEEKAIGDYDKEQVEKLNKQFTPEEQ